MMRVGSYKTFDSKIYLSCGLCEKVCPYIAMNVKGDILKQPIAYFTRSKSDEVLGTSASGGLFYELARSVLDDGGVVFGAVWGEKFDEVYHKSIRTMEELPLLQGSKYLQSDVRQCYSEAKKLLLQDELVLFSGTPCQIAGLLSFLGNKDYACKFERSPRMADISLGDYFVQKNALDKLCVCFLYIGQCSLLLTERRCVI